MSNIEIEGLFLDNNSLTGVPDIAFSFENLNSLSISGNTIPVLPSGSLIFNVPEVLYLGLENLSLDAIENDALQGKLDIKYDHRNIGYRNSYKNVMVVNSINFLVTGNFGPAEIRLGNNNLNKLDSSIFESILYDMAASTGQLVLTSSKLRDYYFKFSNQFSYRFLMYL
jgi:hypothetical protein